jgi:dinuclear metal center YbgI/SA1388 family protein
MTTIQHVVDNLEALAPLRLAEEWDNVGLLVGDRSRNLDRIMTCLTVTPNVVQEAIDNRVELIVTHHPLPFRPLKTITADSPTGHMLLELIAHRIAVYSPHTAFDSASRGINQRLAEGLQLQDISPLVPHATDPDGLGSGRFGYCAPTTTLAEVVETTKQFLDISELRYVGDPQRQLDTLAVACGAAGEFLRPARVAGCQGLVTGETNFHTCLEAEATEVALILVGHYASERFAVEKLSKVLAGTFEQLTVWASRTENDPLKVG